MTADAMSGVQERVLDVGMNDDVAKPINPDVLFKALVKWVKPGERELPLEWQQRQMEVKASKNQPLLILPGFDVERAIARMGGNVNAYRKTLGKVLDAEADAMERIRQSLEAGDRETAVRIAHTMKGVARNIGATPLQSAAADLEAALNDGEEEPPPEALMKLTEQHLVETLNTVQTALQTNEKPEKTHMADMSEITLILEKLKEQINNFDSSAGETCDDLY